MGLKAIRYEKQNQIVTLAINRPPANSWSLAAFRDFETALDAVENDSEIRAVILTGEGEKCFSAGFDVSDAANSAACSLKGQELWRRVDRFKKPIIAAINGHALGGGLELALACHFRIMTDVPKARLGLTELNLGIIPGWGGTQRLLRAVGRSKALEMILLSRRITATEALESGLINQVSPHSELLQTARELAETLATRPPLAVKAVLQAIAAGLYEGIDKGLETELAGSKIVSTSKDAIEGFTAFFEKRPPVFTGE